LLEYIADNKYSYVLFAWRGALSEGFRIKKFRRRYASVTRGTVFHIVVPDFLGVSDKYFEYEKVLVESVHGYWVTCEKLAEIYSTSFPSLKPLGILHDMPDVNLIRDSRLVEKKYDVIWVGNSEWGKRYGFHDHKGFHKQLVPALEILSKSYRNLSIRIIDSSKKSYLNSYVLNEIASSRVLVQCSKSEGTGLPVLEALGLGVTPVTTDVGIATEVLTGTLSKFIVEGSPESLACGMSLALQYSNSDLLIQTFDSYIDRLQDENVCWEEPKEMTVKVESNIQSSIRVRLRWALRFGLRVLRKYWRQR
jgi:glycosyltransferase involved in cell wall biosynthesis